MSANPTLLWAGFGTVSSLVLLLYLLAGGRKNRLDGRLQELSGQKGAADQDPLADFARTTLPKMGAVLVPRDEGERSRLQARLVHAGLYGRQAMVVFLGVKMLLMVGPALLGLVAGALGVVPASDGLIFGAILGVLGMIGPSFWLDRRTAARQSSFRRALPDALDVLVICLEAGVSLPGALRRVSGEIRTAHPLLADELDIVEREVQLGNSPGDALRRFGERSDLEEIRGLAAAINQAERFGASLVKSLRVHAETLRVKRLQRAEEMAQKAAVKLLIPTILFIFPAIFVVVLGPAVFHLSEIFGKMDFPSLQGGGIPDFENRTPEFKPMKPPIYIPGRR
jgi:tight adherence protein C